MIERKGENFVVLQEIRMPTSVEHLKTINSDMLSSAWPHARRHCSSTLGATGMACLAEKLSAPIAADESGLLDVRFKISIFSEP